MKRNGTGQAALAWKIRQPAALKSRVANGSPSVVCSDSSEEKSNLKAVNYGFSFPMSEMKKIAVNTRLDTRTVNLHVPETVSKLDRVYMVRNRSMNILKGIS